MCALHGLYSGCLSSSGCKLYVCLTTEAHPVPQTVTSPACLRKLKNHTPHLNSTRGHDAYMYLTQHCEGKEGNVRIREFNSLLQMEPSVLQAE